MPAVPSSFIRIDNLMPLKAFTVFSPVVAGAPRG
jgi:hypothetical protein